MNLGGEDGENNGGEARRGGGSDSGGSLAASVENLSTRNYSFDAADGREKGSGGGVDSLTDDKVGVNIFSSFPFPFPWKD